MRKVKSLRGDEPIFVVLAVLLVSVILVFMPLAVIWSLNTLFTTLLIPYTLNTWAAVVVLSATLGAKVK